ncbi:hypothetical protein [Actinomyces wuliandei]|nr:hypothetical protein [Actinomyces wuliandei]
MAWIVSWRRFSRQTSSRLAYFTRPSTSTTTPTSGQHKPTQ